MQPEVKERTAFKVMGLQVRVNPMKADYQDIWGNRYAAREAEVTPFSTDQAHYAVYFCTGEQDLVDLVVGMAVEAVEAVPEGLVLREVPAGREAVFTCNLSEIGATWGRIYGEWFPGSQFERDDAGPDYERFPPSFNPATDPLTIHVPVRAKQG